VPAPFPQAEPPIIKVDHKPTLEEHPVEEKQSKGEEKEAEGVTATGSHHFLKPAKHHTADKEVNESLGLAKDDEEAEEASSDPSMETGGASFAMEHHKERVITPEKSFEDPAKKLFAELTKENEEPAHIKEMTPPTVASVSKPAPEAPKAVELKPLVEKRVNEHAAIPEPEMLGTTKTKSTIPEPEVLGAKKPEGEAPTPEQMEAKAALAIHNLETVGGDKEPEAPVAAPVAGQTFKPNESLAKGVKITPPTPFFNGMPAVKAGEKPKVAPGEIYVDENGNVVQG
jgi:hypothetical protein